MIHGIKNGLGWLEPLHRYVYWTKGCAVLTNVGIDEIWHAMDIGTGVKIK